MVDEKHESVSASQYQLVDRTAESRSDCMSIERAGAARDT